MDDKKIVAEKASVVMEKIYDIEKAVDQFETLGKLLIEQLGPVLKAGEPSSMTACPQPEDVSILTSLLFKEEKLY